MPVNVEQLTADLKLMNNTLQDRDATLVEQAIDGKEKEEQINK